jgi:hypothetical protein
MRANGLNHYLNIIWYKRPSVVYQHGQSHIWGGGIGSDVTGSCSDRKWRHRKSRDRKYVLRMSGFPPVVFPVLFPRTFPPYFFKPQRLRYQLVVFLVHDVIKHFIFPYFFSRTFSNRNVWNATLLAFLVHDVIKHFIFPYFFRPQFCKTTLLACLVHDVTKQFIFPYFYPVLSQTATFEIQRLKYQLVVFLVHDVIKSSFSLRIILHGITWHRMT